MSVFKVGDLVRANDDHRPYFEAGYVGRVVDIVYQGAKPAWLRIDFNSPGQRTPGDGRWFEEPELVTLVNEQAEPKSGHSGEHDGLQQHSVGATYPLAVVTYGHDPAIHVIENLRTGEVACYKSGVVIQTTDAKLIFDELRWLVTHTNYQRNWVKGRPKNVGGLLVLVKPLERKDMKHELFLALTNEALRIGRDLTPLEAYQVACDFDNH